MSALDILPQQCGCLGTDEHFYVVQTHSRSASNRTHDLRSVLEFLSCQYLLPSRNYITFEMTGTLNANPQCSLVQFFADNIYMYSAFKLMA